MCILIELEFVFLRFVCVRFIKVSSYWELKQVVKIERIIWFGNGRY